MNLPLSDIREKLLRVNQKSTSVLVIFKTQTALANLRRAQTLIDKAGETLAWAEHRVAYPTSEEVEGQLL